MAITDLTGTTWYFNTSINITNTITKSINFYSNHEYYTSIKVVEEYGYDVLYYGTNMVYDGVNSNPWHYGSDYRTIKILGGTNSTDSTLIAWIQNNATLIGEPTVYLTNSSDISFITEAVKAKGGTTSALTYPLGIATAINNIVTTTPTGTKTITTSGSTDVKNYAYAYVAALNFPTTAAATSTGSVIAAITPGSNKSYINIPSGFNSINRYYEIGAGASDYNRIYNGTVSANTTSTSSTSLTTISLDSSSYYTANSILYVKIRDTAGPRAGYFLGSDSYCFNFNAANNSTIATTVFARNIHRKSSAGVVTTYTAGSTTGYGVYPYSIASNGNLKIYTRYNSTYSLTIKGTYRIEVFLLNYAGANGNPYNYGNE